MWLYLVFELDCQVLLHSSISILLLSGDGGVETAEEAVEPAEPDINELCTDMFEKMAIFLQGELTGLYDPLLSFSLILPAHRNNYTK